MTDIEIINIILHGNQDKFRMLVEKYQSMVFRTCMGFLHDKDDADDLTQEVFIQIYQSLNSFKGDAAFSTWVYRITINASLNMVHKNSRTPILNRIGSLFDSGKEKEKFPPAYYNEDPESILIRHEKSKWIQDALDSLSENQRTAIVLSKYDDLSQKEIAEIMKTTEGAVEALIQRAKANLKVKLSSAYKKSDLYRRKSLSFVSNHKTELKMNCQLCQKESDKYREGKLSDDLRIQVESHLQQCTECAESYRIQSISDSIINQERALTPANDLTARIMGRIGNMEENGNNISKPFIRVLQPALLTTSIAAAIFIGVFIGNIYKPAGIVISRPVELSLIDDAAIESVDMLSNE